MKRSIAILCAILFGCTVATAGVPGVRTEFGVVAGVNQPFMRSSMGQSSATLKATTGFTAGLHLGLRLAGIVGIQPEILYSYNKIAITDSQKKFESDIKCNTIQVPVLLSLRFALVRLNIGPVLTVMDNPTYLDRGSEKVMFGRLYPTVSYAAGVSICLFKRMLIDARVMGGFKEMENFLSYDAKTEGYNVGTTTFNAQLKVGVLF